MKEKVTIADFDLWVRSKMNFDIKDSAINGLQVGSLNREIQHIAFALDASLATFNLAKEADLLFVHHGLFWSKQAINDDLAMYARVKSLIDNDLALYAVHLPLDAAAIIGNNAALAKLAGLTNLEPFAQIGLVGDLKQPVRISQLAKEVFGEHTRVELWPHHNQPLKRIAVMSGGGARGDFVQEAINLGADGYLTGEINHQIYHYTSELGLDVAAGGHYLSEFIGLQHFMQAVNAAFPSLKISLYDLPTGC